MSKYVNNEKNILIKKEKYILHCKQSGYQKEEKLNEFYLIGS